MTFNPRIRTAELALRSLPEFRSFIRVEERGDRIFFINTATGQEFTNPGDAFNNIRELGLVDFRVMSPAARSVPFTGDRLTHMGTSLGLNQFESEIQRVNEYLQAATSDPARRAELESVGLGHLVGRRMSGKFFKFNTSGKKIALEAIDERLDKSTIATAALTDEGYTAIQYALGDTAISGREAKLLQSVVGVSPVQRDFLSRLVSSDDSSLVAKLAKRLQSYLSPRNVALGEEFVSRYLDEREEVLIGGLGMPMGTVTNVTRFEERVLSLDSTAGSLELMFRDPGSEGLAPALNRLGRPIPRRDTIRGIPDFRLDQQERAFLDAGPLPRLTQGYVERTEVVTGAYRISVWNKIGDNR